jgi:hypothetical protein
MKSEYFGLIEMAFTSAVTLGFLGWQYWTVRDAGKPKPPPEETSPIDALPIDSGHPERQHQPHDW